MNNRPNDEDSVRQGELIPSENDLLSAREGAGPLALKIVEELERRRIGERHSFENDANLAINRASLHATLAKAISVGRTKVKCEPIFASFDAWRTKNVTLAKKFKVHHATIGRWKDRGFIPDDRLDEARKIAEVKDSPVPWTKFLYAATSESLLRVRLEFLGDTEYENGDAPSPEEVQYLYRLAWSNRLLEVIDGEVSHAEKEELDAVIREVQQVKSLRSPGKPWRIRNSYWLKALWHEWRSEFLLLLGGYESDLAVEFEARDSDD